MTEWLHIQKGTAPLLVAIPHAGTVVPPVYAGRIDRVLASIDTDWHVDRLYDFAERLGASIISTDIARCVIDVNRDPSGASLYPGLATTELCPTTDFDGAPLYAPGDSPGAADIAKRRSLYFEPYHTAIASELARLRTDHPRVVLYDAHSIRSTVPRLFDGILPHFNIGCVGGTSCAPELAAAVSHICATTSLDYVLNGRFKGGWTTRHYGRPDTGIHAIQMELSQRLYLDEARPKNWDPALAASIAPILAAILTACLDFTKGQP